MTNHSTTDNGQSVLRGIASVTLQLIAFGVILSGAGLAVVSAVFETNFFTALLLSARVAIPLVVALELLKLAQFVFVGAVWSRLSGIEKCLFVALHFGLVAISFSASTGILTETTSQPHRAEVVAQEVARVDSLYSNRIARVRKEVAPKIRRFDSLLVAEEKIQRSDRTFRGPRYNELLGLKEDAIERRDARIKELQRERREQIRQIRSASYADDRRTHNSFVASFLDTLKFLFGARPRHGPAALVIAAVIAAVMEGGIFTASRLTARTFAGEIQAVVDSLDSADEPDSYEEEVDQYEEEVDQAFNQVEESLDNALETLKKDPTKSFDELVEAVGGGLDGES